MTERLPLYLRDALILGNLIPGAVEILKHIEDVSQSERIRYRDTTVMEITDEKITKEEREELEGKIHKIINGLAVSDGYNLSKGNLYASFDTSL